MRAGLLLVLFVTRSAVAGGFLGEVRAYGPDRRPAAPVPGAVVRFLDGAPPRLRAALARGPGARAAPPASLEVTTSRVGRYGVQLAPGSWRLEVEHPDFEFWRVGPQPLGKGSLSTRHVYLWSRALLASMPPAGVFPRGERRGGRPLPALVSLRVAGHQREVGEPLQVELEGVPGIEYQRLMVGCDGCPLEPQGQEHPSGLVRNVFCTEDPCRGTVEVTFHRPGRYLLFANSIPKGDSSSRSLPYAVIEVLRPDVLDPPVETPPSPAGWMR